MNILIFVMSMLMIFALMTYAKLDSYRNHASIEGEFTHYMETIERAYINNSATALYKNISFARDSLPKPIKNTETGNESAVKAIAKGKGTGRLSIQPLIYKKIQEENPAAYEETVNTFKELVYTLFGHQKAFQDLISTHHNLLDAFIEQLPEAVEKLSSHTKINRAIDLSNLQLDPHLNELLYLMFKGCKTTTKKEKSTSETEDVDIPEKAESEEGESEEEDSNSSENYVSDKSDDALPNFIDIHTSLKINIYLASKPLLLALYENPGLVERLLTVRYQLYRSSQQDKMTKEEASDKLYSEFQLTGSKDLLEYKVTGTNPKDYN